MNTRLLSKPTTEKKEKTKKMSSKYQFLQNFELIIIITFKDKKRSANNKFHRCTLCIVFIFFILPISSSQGSPSWIFYYIFFLYLYYRFLHLLNLF